MEEKDNSQVSTEQMIDSSVQEVLEEKLQEQEEAYEEEEKKEKKYYLILIILFLLLGLVSGVYLGRLSATHESIFGSPIKCGKPNTETCKCDTNAKTDVDETTTTVIAEETTVATTTSTSSSSNTNRVTTTAPRKEPSSTVIETPKELTIVFENIELDPLSTVKTKPNIIANTGLEYNIVLNKPRDTYSFTAEIVNKSTMDAKIDTFISSIQSETEANVISYSMTYADGTPINKGDVLPSGKKSKIKFTATYNDNVVYDHDVVSNFTSVIVYTQK